MNKQTIMKDVRRIVVKVGTSTLTYDTGLLNLGRIDKLVKQLSDLQNSGHEIVLVTSGAIGAGMGKLRLHERPKTLPEKQAAAAVGQGVLLHMYQKFFSEFGKTIGQVLLTKDDFSDRRRFIHARDALFQMLRQDVVPIVNENDAVVVDEIKVGDNDTLSALVASLIEADLHIILSDVDGLYTDNPHTNPEARRLEIVETIDQKIHDMSGGAGTKLGTGGMATKINAAEISTAAGVNMVIADGSVPDVLNRIVSGEEMGTLFLGQKEKMKARQHWISFGSRVEGHIYVDLGAEKALLNKKSLLPSGMTKVEGAFLRGVAVEVVSADGHVIGTGITNYAADELRHLIGVKTDQIEEKIGYKDYDEIIHVDNMILRRT
ncbi:glutamate 5-kinase [Fusibacter sp. JL216-2]|uniref:glutamate 5-kinase n=1 Tax=Fusibacter sp. JL216-2 TaxID=3071453 RepID=UPI003D356301